VTRRTRVDAELVRRGLARSRQQAAELIGAGKVSIDGMPAVKPGTAVAATAALSVAGDTERGWMPARRRVDSPKFCWIAAHAKWSPLMWATASWPGRCGRILG
jgi:ribosomal protein S4